MFIVVAVCCVGCSEATCGVPLIAGLCGCEGVRAEGVKADCGADSGFGDCVSGGVPAPSMVAAGGRVVLLIRRAYRRSSS